VGVFEMGCVLITGGAGFIGSHLAERLVKEGYKVILVDNLLKGNMNNLSHVLKDVEFVEGDIRNYELMDGIVRKVDAVIHLAALSRVMPSIENPELCFENNIKGTEIITRLCSKYNRKLIFSSSREVYGTAKYLPADESHPLNPENPYGASKVAAESIIRAYSKCYGLNYTILRLTNVYGPRDFDRVIPTFIEKSVKNENLIVYSEEKLMDFIYISDVVEAFIKALNANEMNLTLNIGSGVGTKILELAKLIQDMVGGRGEIIIKKARKGEVERFVSDIKKAREVLRWEPKTALKDGIKELLNYHS
jgi:UDP-glucose 4-epimerase